MISRRSIALSALAVDESAAVVLRPKHRIHTDSGSWTGFQVEVEADSFRLEIMHDHPELAKLAALSALAALSGWKPATRKRAKPKARKAGKAKS